MKLEYYFSFEGYNHQFDKSKWIRLDNRNTHLIYLSYVSNLFPFNINNKFAKKKSNNHIDLKMKSFNHWCLLPILFYLLYNRPMIANENIFKKLSLFLCSHCLAVLSQFCFSFFSLYSSLISFDQFSDPFVKLFFLFSIDNSSHFIPFVIIQKNLLQV